MRQEKESFLLWPSCFFHRTLCHIDIILFSSRANPLLSFLLCTIRLQVRGLAAVQDILPLCNLGLCTEDRLEKQEDYVVLSSIQSAYDDDMAILKASETSASRYAGSKILVNASGTKMVSFL
jgi:hypothetical protein